MKRVPQPARPWLGGGDSVPLVDPSPITGLNSAEGCSLVSGVIVPTTGGVYQPQMLSATTPTGWSTQEHVASAGISAWAGGFWGALIPALTSGRAYVSFSPELPPSGVIPAGGVWGTSIGPSRRVLTYGLQPTSFNRFPVAWVLEGANSSAGPWTTLDARDIGAEAWGSAVEKVYTVANPGVYTHYRFTFTKGAPNAQYLDFYAIRITYESVWSAFITPTLTGQRTPIVGGAVWLKLNVGTIDNTKTTVRLSRNPNSDLHDVKNLRQIGKHVDGSLIYFGTAKFTGAVGVGSLRAAMSSRQTELRIGGCTVLPLNKAA